MFGLHLYVSLSCSLTPFGFALEVCVGELGGVNMRVGEVKEEGFVRVAQSVAPQKTAPIRQQILREVFEFDGLLDNLRGKNELELEPAKK